MQVKVEDVQVTTMRPKPGQTVYQYILLASDEYMHSEVFFVDSDKADKKKIEELIKKKFAARYKIAEKDVEVKWSIELPKLTK
jgi:hypothetical protein